MYAEDPPTIKELTEVMRQTDIATKWFDLGLQLLGSDKNLGEIEADHRNNVSTSCRTMFKRWLDKTPNATWSQIVTALDDIEMRTAANYIRQYSGT